MVILRKELPFSRKDAHSCGRKVFFWKESSFLREIGLSLGRKLILVGKKAFFWKRKLVLAEERSFFGKKADSCGKRSFSGKKAHS